MLLQFLACLSTAAQSEYPYHFESVESNDNLYGGAHEFVSAVNSLASEALGQLLAYVRDVPSDGRRANLCLDLLELMVASGDLSDQHMAHLFLKLWKMAKKSQEQVSNTRFVLIVRLIEETMRNDRSETHWAEMLRLLKGAS